MSTKRSAPPAGWTPPHARIVTRRSDRRIMGGPGESHNACGAPLSLHDVRPADFRACVREGWPVCTTCEAALAKARA
jgi:hypothetical protein